MGRPVSFAFCWLSMRDNDLAVSAASGSFLSLCCVPLPPRPSPAAGVPPGDDTAQGADAQAGPALLAHMGAAPGPRHLQLATPAARQVGHRQAGGGVTCCGGSSRRQGRLRRRMRAAG